MIAFALGFGACSLNPEPGEDDNVGENDVESAVTAGDDLRVRVADGEFDAVVSDGPASGDPAAATTGRAPSRAGRSGTRGNTRSKG